MAPDTVLRLSFYGTDPESVQPCGPNYRLGTTMGR